MAISTTTYQLQKMKRNFTYVSKKFRAKKIWMDNIINECIIILDIGAHGIKITIWINNKILTKHWSLIIIIISATILSLKLERTRLN